MKGLGVGAKVKGQPKGRLQRLPKIQRVRAECRCSRKRGNRRGGGVFVAKGDKAIVNGPGGAVGGAVGANFGEDQAHWESPRLEPRSRLARITARCAASGGFSICFRWPRQEKPTWRKHCIRSG